MVLSDVEITDYLSSGDLGIEPIDQSQIQPASVDVRLGNSFCIADNSASSVIGFDDKINYHTFTQDEFILLPGQFVLATTMEKISLPSFLTAFVEGKSSLGRMGLFVQNAGWVDPGFEGEITLELFNANNFAIRLQSGNRIAQLVIARAGKGAAKPYSGKYLHQSGATGSRSYLDFSKNKHVDSMQKED